MLKQVNKLVLKRKSFISSKFSYKSEIILSVWFITTLVTILKCAKSKNSYKGEELQIRKLLFIKNTN